MNRFKEQVEMLARAAQKEPNFNVLALDEGRYCGAVLDGEMTEATEKSNLFVTSWLWILGLTLGTTLLCTAILMTRLLLLP